MASRALCCERHGRCRRVRGEEFIGGVIRDTCPCPDRRSRAGLQRGRFERLDDEAAPKTRHPGRVVYAVFLRGWRGRPVVRGLLGPRRSTDVCNGWSPDGGYRALRRSSHLVISLQQARGPTA